MQCKACGEEFHGRAEIRTNYTTQTGRYKFLLLNKVHRPKLTPFVLCPACTEQRAKTTRTFVWGLLFMVAMLGLLALTRGR